MNEGLKILILNRRERAFVKNEGLNNIIDSLKSKTEVEDLWILTDPGKDLASYRTKPLQYNYKFLENYDPIDVLGILDIEKPNVILLPNDYEYVERAFVYAAKLKSIPTVLSLQLGFSDTRRSRDMSLIRNRISILGERGKFILKKYWFLLKTLRKIGYGVGKIFPIIIDDLISPFLDAEPAGKYGCDLILVGSEDMQRWLENRKVKSKIVITGDPLMDSVYKKSVEYKNEQKRATSKMKIVLMTTGMLEHGFWTKKIWETTVTKIITEINTKFKDDVDFLIKIHPATERIEDYERILEKVKVNIPIFQTEKLLDVINDADIIITYGESWGTWEGIFLEKPIIIVNLFDYPIEKMPFVKAGLAKELKNIDELHNLVLKLKNKKPDKEKMENFVRKYLYKLDGKASERSALAIMDVVSENAVKFDKNNS